MIIKHNNIVYINSLKDIGGITTFVYELVKKYKMYDIAVVCKEGTERRIKQISEICPVYKHINEDIECKVAIINYDQSIIPYINLEAKIYQPIHADYLNNKFIDKFIPNDRITAYICLTKYMQDTFKNLINKDNIMQSYNPLEVNNDKPLVLLSATRFTEEKGKSRIEKLANTLDKHNISYIWYIFTDDKNAIDNPNIVYIEPRMDISKCIAASDFLIQLSDTERFILFNK